LRGIAGSKILRHARRWLNSLWATVRRRPNSRAANPVGGEGSTAIGSSLASTVAKYRALLIHNPRPRKHAERKTKEE